MSNTADLVGAFPNGSVRKDGSGFVEYFTGYTAKLAPAPNFGGGADQATLAGRLTNQVVVDASGNIVMQNPEPGRTGNMATNMPGFIGPNQLGFDLSWPRRFNSARPEPSPSAPTPSTH